MKTYYNEEYILPTGLEHRVDNASMGTIYDYIRNLKPKNIVEIGTWYGGVTCMVAAALKKNGGGKLTSFEIEDKLRKSTAKNVKRHVGYPVILRGDIRDAGNLGKVDCLIVDHEHDRELTKWVVKNIFSQVIKSSMVFIHDWTILEKDGRLKYSKDNPWPEARVYMKMLKNGTFPFKRVEWIVAGGREFGVFKK